MQGSASMQRYAFLLKFTLLLTNIRDFINLISVVDKSQRLKHVKKCNKSHKIIKMNWYLLVHHHIHPKYMYSKMLSDISNVIKPTQKAKWNKQADRQTGAPIESGCLYL